MRTPILIPSAQIRDFGADDASGIAHGRSRAAVVDIQALVREGILRGVPDPHGGYALGKDHKRISAADILRVASRAGDHDIPLPISGLVNDVICPALADAERSFAAALRRISVEDLARAAEKQK